MSEAILGESGALAAENDLSGAGLELNLAAFQSEALRRIVAEVADERRTDSVFSNYDRVHNRHNR